MYTQRRRLRVAFTLMGLTPRIAALSKRAVFSYPGKLPAYHLRLKLLRSHRIPALRRLEQSESERALRLWGRRPTATVATIIPTYRRPEQLRSAVESVLAQDFEDHVVIVIDDGCGLGDLPDDPRIFAYQLSRHCGVAGVVRNVGIAASSSRYLAFLDDDNVWLPNHLSVSLAHHVGDTQLTYTAMERVLVDGSRKDRLSIAFDRALLKDRGITDTNVIVVRRQPQVHFSRVPLYRGDFPLEDWEFVYRLTRTLTAAHIPTVTARYLVHDSSFFTDWTAAAQNGLTDAPLLEER